MAYTLRLKQVAKEKGMSMSDLSYETQISEATLSRIINNKQSPSLDMIGRIAEGLGCSISELLVSDHQYIECPHCHKLISVELRK